MSKALEAAPLRDKLLLAISEVHSGNGAEGERIVDAVLSVLSAAPSPESEEVERVADAIIAAQAGPAKKLSDITNQYGRDYELRKARAAIAAMRPTSPEPGE